MDDTAADSRSERTGGLLNRKLKLALFGIIALLALGSPFWGTLVMRRMAFFHVKRIEIIGAHYVAPSDILARLHVDTMASIWDATSPLESRVAAHPEIERVDVSRRMPGTLVITVTERVPVALVPAASGMRVYDERGVVLPIDPARVAVDLPVLAQRDTTVLRLLGRMRSVMPVLYARLSAVSPVGRDELLFELRSQPVRTMKDVTLERLAELEPVEADLDRRQLRAAEIDLRYRDQVIARLQ
jgi:cell division protein FtsQ